MKIKFYLILIFIFSSCTSETNSSQNPDCECTLEPPKDERIFTSTDSSKRKFGVDINIENYVKANFQNGGKTETLVEKILANNPEITQKAYLFWTITLERCKDVCRNNALSNEEKMGEKSKILSEYRSEIAKIIKEDEENSQSTDSEIVEEEKTKTPENRPDPEPVPTNTVEDADGNKYKTVKLLETTWLAENMRYDFKDESKSRRKKDNNSFNKFGRYYTWDVAAEACQKLNGQWRLPTETEWNAVVAKYSVDELKNTGFNVKLGGYFDTADIYKDSPYKNLGRQGHWWSSARENEKVIAYYRSIDLGYLKKNIPLPRNRYYMSCRCVED